MHADPAGCESRFVELCHDPAARERFVTAVEAQFWMFAFEKLGERTIAPFIEMFEVADCWRHGEIPMPSVERSIFLWQARIEGQTIASRFHMEPRQTCPVERDLYDAYRDGLVVILENRGGISLRDTLDPASADLPFPDPCPFRLSAHARPEDRFLVRVIFLRDVALIGENDVSQTVLDERSMADVAELLREARVDPDHPAWAWQLAATWTTVATEDWARQTLHATRGTATRH